MPADDAPLPPDAPRMRLRAFLRPMRVIAVGFVLSYVVLGAVLQSVAFAIAAASIAQYVVVLTWSLRLLAAGHIERAARATGGSLLVMIAIAAPCLWFASSALVLIPLAGVTVVLPYVEPRVLKQYMAAAFGTSLWVIVAGEMLPPLFAAPHPLLVDGLVVAGAAASLALTLRMLWTDSQQLRASLAEARVSAATAAAAVAVRDDFLAVASHELRTPLSALQLQIEMLSRKREDTKAVERLAALQRQSARLGRLVDELLDVSRLGEGRVSIHREPASLAACARDVVAALTGPLQKAGCEIAIFVDDDAQGEWDRGRIEQVVTNLVENAMKYGAGRPVRVDVSVDGDDALLCVRDEGIGMSMSDARRVFDKFERAVSTRHYGGLGLGLWIAARIVEAHGGRIDVDSAPGAGATFTVRLPRRGGDQAASSRQSNPNVVM